METTLNLDLAQVARELNLPVEKIQATVELLDDGNTVPFITRYRKDQTGGLDEEQIREVQRSVEKWRTLADRKQRIIKSLQAQDKLTDELAALIEAADSLRRLEDIYLPFKPKKQTLASLARSRGLEPLACEILNAAPEASDLAVRAAHFINDENGLKSADEVLQGAGHLIAEIFSENLELRDELRRILANTGKLISTRIEESPETEAEDSDETPSEDEDADAQSPPAATEDAEPQGEEQASPTDGAAATEVVEEPEATAESSTAAEPEATTEPEPASNTEAISESSAAEVDAPTPEIANVDAGSPSPESAMSDETAAGVAAELRQAASGPIELPGESHSDPPPTSALESPAEQSVAGTSDTASDADSDAAAVADSQAATVEAPAEPSAEPLAEPSAEVLAEPPAVSADEAAGSATVAKASGKRARKREKKAAAKLSIKELATKTRKESKKRKREKKIESFKDYFHYQEPLSKIPPHRLLAINRGDRSKILRVKIEANFDALLAKAEQSVIPPEHPHAEFLRGRLRDALNRLIIPSLEREVRRELTDYAEMHAVQVFARNLRKLLLQPPVHSRRILAIDPGFRSGCKLAALDECGNVLGHTVIHVIGKEDVVRRGRQQIVEMITMYHIPIIAIGNGTACRETERLVADIIGNELKHHDTQYIVVNEAGASVYSTSSVGREELPRFDPVLRSAVSIGRRLQDPLSELVKINPANIGVGLYQHDVKAKHLQDSLDAVVESCVNFVGVDVNTASPALLRYVSGLNQLTARRLVEYRQKHGPFRNRNQFREIPGFGEATFVQSAGFLKILGGDNPLDATWIHPESYEIAQRVVDKLGGTISEIAAEVPAGRTTAQPPRSAMAQFARGVLAESHHEREDQPAQPPLPAVLDPTSADQAEAGQAAGELRPEASSPPDPTSAASPDPQPADEQQAEASSEGPTRTEGAIGDPPSAPIQETEPAQESDIPAPRHETGATPADDPAPASVPAAKTPDTAVSCALTERAAKANAAQLAAELGIGELLLHDILNSLSRPGRDPREDLPQPLFRREVMKLEDLESGMELTGSVLNVVDFGAFVDIGLPDSGLIHISRLADRFIRDPHEVVSVGDILTVWVVDVDRQRRRVSLTAVRPGTEKPPEQRKERSKPGGRSEGRSEQRGGRPSGRRGDGRRPTGKQQRSGKGPAQQHRPPAKPKPVRPITQDMVEGKEPMRSFSDLLQFFEKKSDSADDDKPKKSK